MLDGVERAFNEAYRLWAQRINQHGGLDEIGNQLAAAATALRNARDLLANPGVKLVDCVSINSDPLVHALRPGDVFTAKPYCGVELKIDESHLSTRRVPTCPDCIEAMRKGD